MDETEPRDPHRRAIRRGWRIRSSAEEERPGDVLSRPGVDVREWVESDVPSTVLAALVESRLAPDPGYGMALREISSEDLSVPWWYRTSFALEAEEADGAVVLELDGVNYSAEVWVNGQRIATEDELRGAYRRFRLDVRHAVRAGENACALRVRPPGPGDYSTGFVDWNPPPPDGNAGLFRTVSLILSRGATIDYPLVESRVDMPSLASAELTVRCHLTSWLDREVTGDLVGRIGDRTFRCRVTLEPGQRREIRLSPEEHPALRVRDPRLWWPWTLGEPALHELRLELVVDGEVWHATRTSFGIRHVEDYRTGDGHRGFRVNGRPVLILAGGWTDELLLRDTAESLEDQIRYVRHLGLNAIRLEGIWGKDQTLYDLCDRYGVLMMVGWSCHWEHEVWLGKEADPRYGGPVTPEDIELVARSWEDQVLWLRHHPSIFVWAVASDKVPHPDLERRYLDTFRRHDPTRPWVASTGGAGSEQGIITDSVIESEVSGATGMKMLGPYAYTPPVYWYTNRHLGGAYGFNTETGPGVQLPVLESIRRFIPEEDLWPLGPAWTFHCGRGEFATLDRFIAAMRHRLGEPRDLEDFVRKGQLLAYELTRPMFEAFRANRGEATGLVHWMLNSAWPKLYWQLYDSFLVPNAAFYAVREACRPLHVLYDYGEHSVRVVSDRRTRAEGLRVRARILDIESRVVHDEEVGIDAPPESVRTALALPRPGGLSATWFLDLRLLDETGHELDHNLYWLSERPDVLDYDAKVEPWAYHTPSRQYADLTGLETLPDVPVRVAPVVEAFDRPGRAGGHDDPAGPDDGRSETLLVESRGESVALLVELLALSGTSGLPIVPALWDENYVSLLPGERRRVRVKLGRPDEEPRWSARGWNLRIENEGSS